MARKRSERLQVLLKLAAMKEQTAARQLAASSERLQQAHQQRAQLADYERDYQQQYVQHTDQPVNRSFFLNFQGFFRQLENVQKQQQTTIQMRDYEREQARLRWVDTYSKRRLLTNVRERWLQSEAQQADKKLQSELDDRSAQALLRNPKKINPL